MNGPEEVLRRMEGAMNAHDLEAYLDCFHDDYASDQPQAPEHAVRGRDHVRRNWEYKLREGSDFRAELLRWATGDATAWAEWRWTSTRPDGSLQDERGVAIYEIEGGRVRRGRLYFGAP